MFSSKVSAEEITRFCSVGQKDKPNYTTMDGSGGYLTLYVKLIQFFQRKAQMNDEDKKEIDQIIQKESKEFAKFDQGSIMDRAQKCFECVSKLSKDTESKQNFAEVSYFAGGSGIYLNACFLAYFQDDSSLFKKYLSEILKYKLILLKKPQDYPHELLYGVAGYLYCLIELQQTFQQDSTPEKFKVNLQDHVRDILELLIEDGLSAWGDELNLNAPPKDFRLYYTFSEKEYFGAAHGLFGILYILMRSVQINKSFLYNETESFAKAIEICIKSSIEYLLKFQLSSGNFPPYESKKNQDYLVQFCHGAPGAIPCLLQAADLFKSDNQFSQQCIDAAEKASECVWQYGILKKGFGLCHGVPGSAFSFLTMYRYTSNPTWLYRAYKFILMKNEQDIVKVIQDFEFSQRYQKGTSDYPFSLMVGLAGDICCESESIFPDSARFPGYEV